MFRPPPLPRTLGAALRDVADAKAVVRADAVRELVPHAETSRAEVLRALEGALVDPMPQVRKAAALAFADVDAHEAVPALLEASNDTDGEVRAMSVAALGELGDAQALERIERALRDERAEVRFQAVIAFPRLVDDPDRAMLALEAATRDDDALVAHIALRIAEELGERAGEVDSRLLRRARAMLGHDAPTVRVGAAVLLARAGERAGEEVLVALVNGDLTTREGEDEAAAIELCGDLAIEAAEAGLERRAFSGALGLFRDRFAWHARVALARMGHAKATREIVEELSSWNRDKRTLAVAAAGRAKLKQTEPTLRAMGEGGLADQHALEEALRSLSETG